MSTRTGGGKAQKTTAVYFRDAREMRLVKRAARRLGKPWTVFIREACVARANEIVGGGVGGLEGEAA